MMIQRACSLCFFLGLFHPCFAEDVPQKLVSQTDPKPSHQMPANTEGFMRATFQQTFLLTYTKAESGHCPDLTVYLHLLSPALRTGEQQLPHICDDVHEDAQDASTGQLVLSGIAERGQNILVNVTLMYDPSHKEMLENCTEKVKEQFKGDDSTLTQPFRQRFSPMNCPAILTSGGAILVHSGYFCRDASQILTQAFSQSSTEPIIICEFCPVGEEKWPGSEDCGPCQQGFYKSDRAAALCTPCPAGYVTRLNGSASRHNCSLRACEAGSYADVSDPGVCKLCPFGTYQAERWQQQCWPCPAGLTTYQEASVSPELCLPDCEPGQELSNITQTCQPCPIGFYNDDLDPSRGTCILCPIEFITERTGSTSLTECSVRNCTVRGQYRDPTDNVCRDCPLGQWQNQKWRTSCHHCDFGLTTGHTGAWDPSACYNAEKIRPFQDNDYVVIGMLAVLVLLVIGNLIVVGYCLCCRRRQQLVIPVSSSDDVDEPCSETWKASNRKGSWEYQDIDLYDIIRDVLPDYVVPVTSQSTFRSTDGLGAEAAAGGAAAGVGSSSRPASSLDAIIYTEQRKYAVACSAGEKDLVDLQAQTAAAFAMNDDDSEIYDDITNTCPIYENAETLALGSSLYASARPALPPRQDILY